MLETDHAEKLLVSRPNEFKRCVIHLDGPFNAKCKIINIRDQSRDEALIEEPEDEQVASLREVCLRTLPFIFLVDYFLF